MNFTNKAHKLIYKFIRNSWKFLNQFCYKTDTKKGKCYFTNCHKCKINLAQSIHFPKTHPVKTEKWENFKSFLPKNIQIENHSETIKAQISSRILSFVLSFLSSSSYPQFQQIYPLKHLQNLIGYCVEHLLTVKEKNYSVSIFTL